MNDSLTDSSVTGPHAVIAGGGVAGLAAAMRLQDAGVDRITLLEKDEHLGGKIVTERHGDFVVEAGPDCFLARKPRGIGICEELGIAKRLVGRQEAFAHTYVRRGRALHRLPAGLSGMIPTDLDALEESALLSDEGRARLALESEQAPLPAGHDESLADFVTRRMGREAYERLVEPLMGGIYAGDAEQLSLAATFPQLRQIELEYGSLLTGLKAAQERRADHADSYPPFVSFGAGMSDLVQSMAAEMSSVQILQGRGVESIESSASGYDVTATDGTGYHANALILAVPAFVTARLVAKIDAELAAAHAQIPYGSSAIVTLAFRLSDIEHPMDGYGYVVPRVEGDDILACTWTSRKWANRAPDGTILVRVYMGRYGRADVLDKDDLLLMQMAREELSATLGIEADPLLSRVFRWPMAMPQYTMGHVDRLQTIDERLSRYPGLYVAGAAYRGVGIPDCIRSGEAAADAAVAFLRSSGQ